MIFLSSPFSEAWAGKDPFEEIKKIEGVVYRHWDEGTKNGPDRSALLGHNFVYQETKPHGFYSSYFH